jgi:hypothetical protein
MVFVAALGRVKIIAPPLNQVLKKFFLKVHPDRFSNEPEAKGINEKSFMALQVRALGVASCRCGAVGVSCCFENLNGVPMQSFLQEIKATKDNTFPESRTQQLVFFVWDNGVSTPVVAPATKVIPSKTPKKVVRFQPTVPIPPPSPVHAATAPIPPSAPASSAASDLPPPEPKLKKIGIVLRTTGNDCRHLVAKSIGELLNKAGLPGDFTWGDDYWNDKAPTLAELQEELFREWSDRKVMEKGFESSQDEEAFHRARAARANSA